MDKNLLKFVYSIFIASFVTQFLIFPSIEFVFVDGEISTGFF